MKLQYVRKSTGDDDRPRGPACAIERDGVVADAERLLRLRKLTALIQPIEPIGQNQYALIAVEGLVRGPAASQYLATPDLFGAARRNGLEGKADPACVASILSSVPSSFYTQWIARRSDLPRTDRPKPPDSEHPQSRRPL